MEFKSDLEEYAGTSQSPKKDLLYSIIEHDIPLLSEKLEYKAELYLRLSELIK